MFSNVFANLVCVFCSEILKIIGFPLVFQCFWLPKSIFYCKTNSFCSFNLRFLCFLSFLCFLCFWQPPPQVPQIPQGPSRSQVHNVERSGCRRLSMYGPGSLRFLGTRCTETNIWHSSSSRSTPKSR